MKGKRCTHVAASSPSLEEARSWLESPAVESGMSAKILPDFDSEVRKVHGFGSTVLGCEGLDSTWAWL